MSPRFPFESEFPAVRQVFAPLPPMAAKILAVLMAIADRTPTHLLATVSIEHLMELAGCSRRSCSAALTALKHAGFITSLPRRYLFPNKFILTTPAPLQPPSAQPAAHISRPAPTPTAQPPAHFSPTAPRSSAQSTAHISHSPLNLTTAQPIAHISSQPFPPSAQPAAHISQPASQSTPAHPAAPISPAPLPPRQLPNLTI